MNPRQTKSKNKSIWLIIRKIIPLVIFILSIQSIFGQNLNLLNSGYTWSNLKIINTSFDCCTYTDYFKFSGDTVLNSVTYKKVLQSSDSLQSQWEIYGFVREDPQIGFYLKELRGTQEEWLLYNYNLKLNDTVKVPSIFANEDSVSFIVTNIEDVLIDGSIKKEYHLVYPAYHNYTETWIESIGSLKGLFRLGFYGCLCDNFDLLCCFLDDQLIYKNHDFDRCYYSKTPTDGLNTLQSRKFNLIQGISNQQITMQFPGEKQRKISIYNCSGILIEEFVCYEAEKILNISNYRTGMYFIVSIGENKTGLKFIKY